MNYTLSIRSSSGRSGSVVSRGWKEWRLSGLWFTWLALLAIGGFLLGNRLGRGDSRRACTAMIASVVLIAGWTWLMRNPAVALGAMPIWFLSHVEGTGSVPLFMLVTGIAWSRAQLAHQKRLTILAAFFGGLFFLQGSMWMLQSTPSSVLGSTRSTTGITLQSQDFSCVPAACTTALRMIGIDTTEAEMAGLTQTRAGTGSTLIRALDGLTTRLAGTGWRAQFLEPSMDDLASLTMPLITPLQFEMQRLHMVTVLGIDRGYVRIADPESGVMFLTDAEFAKVYTGRVISFMKN